MVAKGDAYGQAKQAIHNIETALGRAGGSLRDVVRTRIYTTDISRWQEIGRAHREAFADIQPANLMVQVQAFVSPDMLVEIEADAVLGAAPLNR
jgi:enamine deaminase RidA (YjgF/YER057c/UK114 family)